MRHAATLVAALEGISRPAFHIAKELAANSRSGLTTRFLSKKLELTEEEVEYLIDVNHKLFFHDITKIKLVAEGQNAVKRIQEGLESRGDVPALQQIVRNLPPYEFRLLEEALGIDKPGPKKQAAETLIDTAYGTPDAIVTYVAQCDLSPLAKDMFDILWQARDGMLAANVLRTKSGETEFKAEEAISELANNGVAFEMFRFDDQDRLVRMIGLLAELRNYRKASKKSKTSSSKLRALRKKPEIVRSHGMRMTDAVCRLSAGIAARPARLRGDGDLFREDQRRLEEIFGDDDDPDMQTCLWIAESAGWIARVDNELRAADLDSLIELDRGHRHKSLFDRAVAKGGESKARKLFGPVAASMRPNAWYRAEDIIDHAVIELAGDATPHLHQQGGHWAYTSQSAGGTAQKSLAGALDELFVWFGAIDRAEIDDESVVSLTDVGHWLLNGGKPSAAVIEASALESEIVVQPNFDIVVPGHDTDPLLTVPLEQFTDRQSTGTAIVYNLSKASFTRGIQDGQDGHSFVQFLLTHNRSDSLPANVLQSLEDWRGSVKHVRVRTIHVLEADDPLIIADLLHRRRLSKYFSNLDPGRSVAFSKTSKAEITRELEKEGFVVG